MPLSAVQISNLALARIHILQGIDDIDEASDEARAIRLVWDACLDELMTQHDWPFCSNRTMDLGLVATDVSDAWTYSYRLPSDYLMAGDIGEGIPFQISSDDSGALLLANINPATLTYRARISDVALLPHDVAMVLAGRLSVEIGPPLSRTDAVVERASKRYERDLAICIAKRLNEPGPDDAREAEAVSARA